MSKFHKYWNRQKMLYVIIRFHNHKKNILGSDEIENCIYPCVLPKYINNIVVQFVVLFWHDYEILLT